MKKKILLSFKSSLTGKPFSYNLIKEFNLEINILKASIDYNIEGLLLLEVQGIDKNIQKGIQYLIDNGVSVNTIENPINIDKNECVQCGTCIAACSVNALSMNTDFELEYDGNLCMECMLCLKACPLRAIKSNL